MSSFAITGIMFLLLFLLLASGTWIGVAVGVVGAFGLYQFVSYGAATGMSFIIWKNINSFILTCIPLFIFMSEVLMQTGISQRLYRGVSSWVGHFPGGLTHSNIVACAIFSAVSGSSSATAATVSVVAYPEMDKRGYDRKLILGSLAAGGTLGTLIPPSLSMIMYGVMVEESIGKLFMAGVIPGIIFALMFMTYIVIISLIHPHLTPQVEKSSWKEKLLGIKEIGPVGIIIFAVLGTLYLGVATPTEAAALGAFSAMILGLFYRKLNFQVLKSSLVSAARTSCFILFVVMGALIFSLCLANLRVPAQLAQWIGSLDVPPVVVLISVYLLYIFLGMFVDAISMLVLTLPVIYPMLMTLGYDSIWFGLAVTVLTEIAVITPPVGVNLFVLLGVSKRPFGEIVKGAFPFFILLLGGLALITIFPQLGTWLPSQM